MKLRPCILILAITLLTGPSLRAQQDTLPQFSLRHVGNNRVILGWINNYPEVLQISIQRSHDSLAGYKTILSVTDPMAVQNGFADTKAPNDHMFYRLFINLGKGNFFFTPARKPVQDTARKLPPTVSLPPAEVVPGAIPPKTETGQPVKKPDVFVPSSYIYTGRDGYVHVNLPGASGHKYRIRFYEEDETFLFEIKNIRDNSLMLDKSNFYRAGWYRFELFDEEKLVEKHRFYLGRSF
ncbi:MAG TPA: hypothetical protein VHK69_09690 [Chitinophagaceae bacterium]|jgi:hypothetical protein|nr:hypothetical protein [Chitinophagaceae bacterium]